MMRQPGILATVSILPSFCPPTGFESGRCQRPTSTRKPGWSPTCIWLLFSPCPTPHHAREAGSGRAQTLPRWLLPDTDSRIDKDRIKPNLEERPSIFSMSPNQTICSDKSIPDRHGFWGRFVKSLQNTASRRFSVAFHGLGNGRRLC